MSVLYSEKIAKVSGKKEKNKKVANILHLYYPPFLRDEEVGAALGNLDSPAMRLNVKLFYTYLNKVHYQVYNQDSTAWVGVHKDVRRSLLGNDYVEVVKRLVSWDLLELRYFNVDGRFFPEGYCRYGADGANKSYCAPLHLIKKDQPWRHEECELTPRLRQKLNSVAGRGKATMEEYRALTAANMKLMMLVDTPECRAAIDAFHAQFNHRPTAAQYLDLFNNFPFAEPVADDFGARLHHEVVRLPKSLRPFLRFRDHQDQEVVEVDLVASQPSFLANITPKLIEQYAPECAEAIPYFEKYSQDETYKAYQQHCFEGTIYEHLRDEFNKRYGSSLVAPVTRDDAKNIYYNAAFSNYKFKEKADNPASLAKTEARLAKHLAAFNLEGAAKASATLFKKRSYTMFKELFPALHQLFADLKDLNWDFNPSKDKGKTKKFTNNCLLAQRVESGIVYLNLVKSLVNAGIERFTTTHDSLNVMKCDEKLARRVVKVALKQARLKMQLKTKDQAKPVVEPVEEEDFMNGPVFDVFELDLLATTKRKTQVEAPNIFAN